MSRALVPVAAALFLLACSDGEATLTTAPPVATGALPGGFTVVSVELTGPGAEDGSSICCVYLADSPGERARGLMDVTDLGAATGMVFAYQGEQRSRFYMFDTPMPLSIAFFDGEGRFVSSADMDPCTSDEPSACERYGAGAPFQYALEVPRGELEVLGVGPATSLEILPGSERRSCAVDAEL